MYKIGQELVATRGITFGFIQSELHAVTGDKLIYEGKSSYASFPLSVSKAYQRDYCFAVDENEVEPVKTEKSND